MPYPQAHQYVNVIGDSYGATERWQFGFRITDGGISNEVTALAIAPLVEAFWRGTAPAYTGFELTPSPNHRLTELKVARIQPDGTYPPNDPSYSHFYLPPINGNGAASVGQTPQDAMCATLITALPRGLASKGRLYLPPNSRMRPGADGLIPAGDATALANAVWTLLQAVNANAQVGNVAIFSRGRGVPAFDAEHNRIEYTYPNPGATNNVTGVKVGRVVDTQRRRRRSLSELYQNDGV